jgi:hypothetical protein
MPSRQFSRVFSGFPVLGQRIKIRDAPRGQGQEQATARNYWMLLPPAFGRNNIQSFGTAMDETGEADVPRQGRECGPG